VARALAVGIVVDDPVAVLENRFRFVEEKELPLMQPEASS